MNPVFQVALSGDSFKVTCAVCGKACTVHFTAADPSTQIVEIVCPRCGSSGPRRFDGGTLTKTAGNKLPWNRYAVASSICTIVGLFFWPVLLAALVLMLLALHQSRKTGNVRGVRIATWTLAPVLFVLIGIVSLILWIMVPNAIRAYRVHSELNILHRVEEMRTALLKYRLQHGGYPASAQSLFDEGLLDPKLADGIGYGYHGTYNPGDKIATGGELRSGFFVLAQPGSFSLGRRLFALDETGVIQIQESEESASVSKIPAPSGWPPPIEKSN